MIAVDPLVEVFEIGGPVLVAIAGVSVVGWSQAVTVWFRIADERNGVSEDGDLAAARATLRVLACLVGALPMLGLLGTISGMIATFGSLSSAVDFRTDDVAGGIREALVTTEAGLLLAIPLRVAHGWMTSQLKSVRGHPGSGGGE